MWIYQILFIHPLVGVHFGCFSLFFSLSHLINNFSFIIYMTPQKFTGGIFKNRSLKMEKWSLKSNSQQNIIQIFRKSYSMFLHLQKIWQDSSLALSSSSRGSLISLRFPPLGWYHLHIWVYCYFSWQSWLNLVLHQAQHFT